MRVMLDKNVKITMWGPSEPRQIHFEVLFLHFQRSFTFRAICALNGVPWPHGEQRDRRGRDCRRGVARMRPQRIQETTSTETTRVASGSHAWGVMDHRTGEQYPVNNKIFMQLSSSGGIE